MYRKTGNEGLASQMRWTVLMALFALVAVLACGLLMGCSVAPESEDAGATDAGASEAAEEASGDETAQASEGDMADVAVPGGGEGLETGDGTAEDVDAASEAGDVDEYAGLLEATDESRADSSKSDMQTIGSRAVGYMAVPSSWTDRIEDVDPNLVDAYEMVYYADPGSEYTSAALSHFAFAKGVQLTVQPTSYREIAAGIAESYENSSITGDFSQGEVMIGGRDAILLVTSIPEDNQLICCIVIDRDGDGHAAVAIACNCGSSTSAAEEVLSYVATWQPA